MKTPRKPGDMNWAGFKLFVEYAEGEGQRERGSSYMIFTKLINSKVGLSGGQRDDIFTGNTVGVKIVGNSGKNEN